MKCDICDSDNQVRHLDNLYTIGSEGTRLCNECCVNVSNYIRGLKRIISNKEKECYKKWRK